MNAIRTDEEWFSIINECRSSGLPDKSWCREHGISPSSFYYNIRRLRKLACGIPEAKSRDVVAVTQEVVPLQVSDSPGNEVINSYAVPTPSQSHEGNVSVIFIECNGITVTCKKDVSLTTICNVIQALRAEC